ncbi:P-type conjugative transfer protein TrbL [Methylophilus luteus]|uniref:P-type conjugative transfer protein TrbL n=1 Tax=Methylophilus luteus TaxID=640108 RepID=A0ABW3F8G1_9PROT
MFLTSSKSKWFLIAAIVVLMVPDISMAMSTGTPMEVQNEFKKAAFTFANNISSLALKLLWGLAALETAWGTAKHVLEQHPFEKLVGMLFKIAFFPALYTLLVHKGSEWLPAIVEGFKLFGTVGTGLNQDIDPLTIFDMGVALQNSMVTTFNQESGADSAIGALQNIFPALLMTFICIIILISFAAMALLLFLSIVEAYLLMAVAPILFAFGGARWTKDIATKPFNSMIAVGLKITILYLILSISLQLAPLWAKTAANWTMTDWSPLWYVAFSAVATGVLTWKIPKIAADALSGSASLSAGEALQITAAAIAGLAGAAALGSKAAETTANGLGTVLDKGLGALGNGLSNLRAPSIEPMSSNVPVPDPTGPAPRGDGSTISTSNSPGGNAKGANLSGTGSVGQTSSKAIDRFAEQQQQRRLSERFQDSMKSLESAIPNDQATVGGDLVKNHSE